MKKKIIILGLVLAGLFSGCSRESEKVSYNLSYKADNFQVLRRVVFFNGITDKYLLEIRGYCSIESDNYDKQLEVTCKVGPNKYIKDYFGLSDNTAYFVEQLEAKNVSAYYHKIIFRPQAILPSFDVRVTDELPEQSVKIEHKK